MAYADLKRWRCRTKDRIILAMGGKCCICNYNRCPDAMASHHLDPKEKDFNFGGIRANAKAWWKIVAELRKCILLCHVCHSEVHAGYATIPEYAPKFNESYSVYSSFPEPPKDNCPACQSLKPVNQKTCSKACSMRYREQVRWDQIDLEKELKTSSVLALSKRIGCSDVAIHKRLKKLSLK